MIKYLIISICLTIQIQAFTQNVSIPELGWTIKLPANADDFTKDLLYKISVAAGHIRTVPIEMATVPDYKGEALSQSLIYRTEERYVDFGIGIGFETLNPAAFINTGWKSVFYNKVEENSGTTSTSSDNGNDIDTTTSFETIGNSFFAVFKKKTTYKSSKYQSLNSTAYTFYTNRDNNKLVKIEVIFSNEKKGQDALTLIHNSSFTPITQSSEKIPFTSVKLTIEDELKKYYFTKSTGDEIDKVFTRPYGASFAGTKSEWKQYLHCCLDQSALTKDNVSGNKSVTVKFLLNKDGQPSSLEALNFPEECPDCAIEALKLFYKHVQPGASSKCNVITTKEPYRQWQPSIVNGRKASSYVTVIIPFGYDDDPANDQIINEHYKENLKQSPNSDNDANSNSGLSDKTKTNTSNNDDDNLQEANVVEQNGKYILTLLRDSSRHVVFRPLPKNMDTAMVNKINIAIGINQGGWGEIAKDKNGKQLVTFYSFIGAGSNEIKVAPVPIDFFKNMFYAPK